MAAGPTQPLGALPAHFRREQQQLEAAGICSWKALAELNDASLRQFGRQGGASERRLIKLRGQARLVVEVGLRLMVVMEEATRQMEVIRAFQVIFLMEEVGVEVKNNLLCHK